MCCWCAAMHDHMCSCLRQVNADELHAVENLVEVNKGWSSMRVENKGEDPVLAPGPYRFGIHHWYRIPSHLHVEKEAAAIEAKKQQALKATAETEDDEEEGQDVGEEGAVRHQPQYMAMAYPTAHTQALGFEYKLGVSKCYQEPEEIAAELEVMREEHERKEKEQEARRQAKAAKRGMKGVFGRDYSVTSKEMFAMSQATAELANDKSRFPGQLP